MANDNVIHLLEFEEVPEDLIEEELPEGEWISTLPGAPPVPGPTICRPENPCPASRSMERTEKRNGGLSHHVYNQTNRYHGYRSESS